MRRRISIREKSLENLNDLYYFVQVVRHGGFAQAGRLLNIPKSRLSRRVAALEERLGVRLVHRSSRSFSVTHIGQEYYAQCQAMLAGAEAAQEVIDRGHAEPQGILRVTAPPALIQGALAQLVARFMIQCPKVHVHLKSLNRPVDVLSEGFDLAVRVRFGPVESSDLVMKPLGVARQRLVASPRLLARGAAIRGPEDLARLPSVALGTDLREGRWDLEDDQGRRFAVALRPRLATDDATALKAAVLAGVGAGVLPLVMVREELRAGTLVALCEPWQPAPGQVHAVFPSRRGVMPAVRELLEFLGKEYPRDDDGGL
ncbi:LysR family transcriptional regulator [Bordetella bronchiseptica]|nr:LysR family transcriptional regulator [Bordetella bronchiseptica]KDB59562.1 LysR substrate-binding domain protein [Bordetella bronchiseptica A1-7]KDB68759.1 LysR substrate-binding domain protein [Bordetella bronchiseptica B20-10725633]KDC79503.1 LysR substrate-binding domain protein [Bordetella bronchiseptica MBORD632]KDC87694.1 LysR substrate-binding domain protein [Bordetella bronchiseptica MBORD668]KDC88419.1 LysR substrate-binding domain protein [Bordetella bronchiseptica MBORD665]KDD0